MAFKYTSDVMMLVDGYDISTATRSVSVTIRRAYHDVTGLNLGAAVGTMGLRGGDIEHDGMAEDSANGINTALSTIQGTTNRVVSLLIGTAQGGRAIGAETNAIGFKHGGAIGDIVAISGQFQVGTNIDAGTLLQPKAQFAASTSGTIYDDGTASTNGARVYLHVTAAAGTGTVRIEHSTSSTFGSPSNLILFAGVDRVLGTLLSATGSTQRYIRATYDSVNSTGTATFAVVWRRA